MSHTIRLDAVDAVNLRAALRDRAHKCRDMSRGLQDAGYRGIAGSVTGDADRCQRILDVLDALPSGTFAVGIQCLTADEIGRAAA